MNDTMTMLEALRFAGTPLCLSAATEIEALQKKVDNERELRIMQLAGISTASLQNSDSTVKDRIGKSNSYWTQAYGDVCVAIDREMALRKERDELKRQNAALVECMKVKDEAIKRVMLLGASSCNNAIEKSLLNPDQHESECFLHKALAAQPEVNPRKVDADLYEANQWLRNAERILMRLGYERCTAPACNCSSYHKSAQPEVKP